MENSFLLITKKNNLCFSFKGDRLNFPESPDMMYIVTRSKTEEHLVLDNQDQLLLLDDEVSEVHALINLKSASKITIEDTHSLNGTFINGTKMNNEKAIDLKNGDVLKIGHRNYRLERIEDATDVPKIIDVCSSEEDEKSLPKKRKIRRVENERGK